MATSNWSRCSFKIPLPCSLTKHQKKSMLSRCQPVCVHLQTAKPPYKIARIGFVDRHHSLPHRKAVHGSRHPTRSVSNNLALTTLLLHHHHACTCQQTGY